MSKAAILIDDDRDDLEFLEEAIRQVDHSVKCISYLFCDDALRKICGEGWPLIVQKVIHDI